jgi:hypothetical protein
LESIPLFRFLLGRPSKGELDTVVDVRPFIEESRHLHGSDDSEAYSGLVDAIDARRDQFSNHAASVGLLELPHDLDFSIESVPLGFRALNLPTLWS